MLFKSFSNLFGCIFCSFFIFSSSALAVQQANFSWLPNNEENLAGYKIYYGTVSSQYQTSVDVGNPGVVNGVVQTLVSGLSDNTTYYFAATAYDNAGNESDYSQEVIWTSSSGDELIIDNDNSGTSMSGSWELSGGVGYYGTQSVFSKTVNGSYTYNANISGPFELSLRWTEWPSRCTNVPIEVYDNNALIDSFDINQQNNGAQWNVIGDYDIIGPVRVVVISTSSVCSTNADAVRFIFTTKEEQPVTPPSLPVANSISLSTVEDAEAVGQLDGESVMGAALNYQIVSNGALGKASITNKATGSFVYTPNENVSGIDTFSYKVNDVYGESSSAIVTVTINPINDAPVAYDGILNLQQDEEVAGVLQGSDIDSSQLTYSIVSNGDLGKAILMDSSIGTYAYIPNEGVYGEDILEFSISDGEGVSNIASVAVTISQEQPPFNIEIGEVTVDGTWTTVSFSGEFSAPVVIAKPASNNDPSPCVVRIRNLSSAGFEIRLQQYEYLAQEHGMERLSYIAVERGSFTLENGRRIEAGTFTASSNDYPEIISFTESFPVTPVVVSSIITENESDAVVSRIDNVSENGFDFLMQEQGANNPIHDFEEIAYIAWEPFEGQIGEYAFEIGLGIEADDQWQPVTFTQNFAKAPVFIADMQSSYGLDTANLRHRDLSATGVQVKVAEEQSNDDETAHAIETLGFIAISVKSTDESSVADDINDLVDEELNLDQGLSETELDPEIPDEPSQQIWEVGTVEIASQWQRVSFETSYNNPVVVAKIITANDDSPCVVRLNNIDNNGFDIRIQEWDYLDDAHDTETVSYIVMEQGSYILENGAKIEAGQFSVGMEWSYTQVNFGENFNIVPVVSTTIASVNEVDAVTGRMWDVDESAFSYAMQEQESNIQSHSVETVHYIAWEPSKGIFEGITYEVNSTGDKVRKGLRTVELADDFNVPPVMFAEMQSADSADTASVRIRNILATSTAASFDVNIEEEQSKDRELSHTSEEVGYMAFGIN